MPPKAVDSLISGAKIVTMDSRRRILMDGLLAIKGDRIIAVGPRAELEGQYEAGTFIDGSRFVITPGFVNGHVHITGDPLTRGFMPDDLDCGFAEKLTKWVIPRYVSQTPEDEKLAARLAALEMLKSGTTCFLEAGTIRHLGAVVDALNETGIRGRVGQWVEGRAFDAADDEARLSAEAIARLRAEIADYPADDGARIAAWPILIGHATNSDAVWQAAKALADEHGLVVAAHMSPYETDADWYQDKYGCRPIEHLAKLGVLGHNLLLTHATHISDNELGLLTESGTNIAFCPFASLLEAFGVAAAGRYAEMAKNGINITLGSDGFDTDMLHLARLASVFHKDREEDITLFPAHEALAMITLNGAAALGLAGEIGSLEAGMKADFVCHDIDRPEWCPLLNVLNQLVWSADGRGVHSLWVDGVRLIDNYRATMIDEAALYAEARAAGARIVARTALPAISPWPIE